MTINDVIYILLGGGLVCFGVLAVATADRIRDNTRHVRRGARLAIATVVAAGPKVKPMTNGNTPLGIDPMSRDRLLRSDVISALAQAGYKRATATAATDACALSERATLECWTRAALRNAVDQERLATSYRSGAS